MITTEDTKPPSDPIVTPSTCYRSPQSSPDRWIFSAFEQIIIDNIEAENLELYLLCDLNCNFLSEIIYNNSSHL